MKQKVVYLLILLLLAGFGLYQYISPPVTPPSESSESVVVSPTSLSSRYVPYSPGVLETVVAPRRVLYFYANWCPTCRPANLDFEQNQATFPADVTVIRINYNDSDTDQAEKDLAQEYGITYQHTFVQIDADGKEITKWNGGATAELLARLK